MTKTFFILIFSTFLIISSASTVTYAADQVTLEIAAKDPKVAELMPAAEAGDAEAQYKIARIIIDKPHNDALTAKSWFEKAIEQNHCEAIKIFGFVVQSGWGKIKKDKKEAIKYFTKGADANCAGSQTMLGHAYKKGQGVKKNNATALHWYKKAGTLGEPIASYFLGEFYWKGKGTDKDHAQSLYWLMLANESETAGRSKQRVEKLISKVRKKLDGDQIALVEKRVDAWKQSQEDEWETLLAE